MARAILVDGRPVASGEAAIAADDPGLLGQGVYESLRTYDGEPFAVDRHLERLVRGATALGIEVDRAVLAGEVAEAARAAGGARGAELTVRVVLTGGGRRVVDAGPLRLAASEVRAVTLPWRRLAGGPLEGVKAASTAATLVARRHVQAAGADDGIWVTLDGAVSEALAANVFAVVEGRPVTPPLADGALPGVTRGLLLELGAAERRLTVDELHGADEAFLASTSAPARPLLSLDGREIGGGRGGPLTREIAATFATRARALA